MDDSGAASLLLLAEQLEEESSFSHSSLRQG
jgi:hypothetical protein